MTEVSLTRGMTWFCIGITTKATKNNEIRSFVSFVVWVQLKKGPLSFVSMNVWMDLKCETVALFFFFPSSVSPPILNTITTDSLYSIMLPQQFPHQLVWLSACCCLFRLHWTSHQWLEISFFIRVSLKLRKNHLAFVITSMVV